ncbi:small nuclear ribonucleoprotein [Peziza echinospora]|nr:small nuclear ribonucleoprotein [Peziza echinospora]
MAAEQRKLLEQLMGHTATSSASSVSLTDPRVCKSFIVGTCPHDLFTNTKFDLGPCPKIHSEQLKNEYERATPKPQSFEHDYLRDLTKFIDECNRRIEAAQRRLDKTPDEITKTNSLLKAISDLDKSISTGLQEVEILGETGQVGRALEEYFKVRQSKKEKEDKERELKQLSDTSGPSGHQKLQVCDVCGAYLSRLDNDRRLADHFYGKMHLGYASMRKELKRLQEELGKRPGGPSHMDHPHGPRDFHDRGGGGGFDAGFGDRDHHGGRGGFRGGRGGGFRGGRGGGGGGGGFGRYGGGGGGGGGAYGGGGGGRY